MELPEYYEPKKASGGDPFKARPYYGDASYIGQPKIDGVRYHIYIERNGRVRIYSRSTSRETGLPVDKTDVLSHLASEAGLLFPGGSVLDGEVMCAAGHRTTFKDVTRISGASPQEALRRQQRDGFLRFCAFDVIAWSGVDLASKALSERLSILDTYVSGKHIFPIETAYTERDKWALRDRIVAEGGEGLILKRLDSVYNPKRNKDWVKDKFVVHVDVVFMGIKMAKEESVKKGDVVATPTRVAGLAGGIRFGQWFPVEGSSDIILDSDKTREIDGQLHVLREIGSTSGFDDEMRMDVTLNADMYSNQMRVFTVRAQMQYSDTFALREPRFESWRDDKNFWECIYDPDLR